MFVYTVKFSKKTAVFSAVMAILVIIGIVLLCNVHSMAKQPAEPDLATEKGRVEYLSRCGWQVDSPAENEAKVSIPQEFSKVYSQYNELQKQQGFDLQAYAGREVTVYTYHVKNRPDGNNNVYAQLYICDGCIIGGDVHSTELDGFIQGIR